MPQEIDHFTIPVPQSIDMGACDLEVYSGLHRLWRMVARYTMASPLTITVVDNKAEHVRSIRGSYDQATGWKLRDATSTVVPAVPGNVEFPVTIRVQDARGSILKMRVQIEATIPNSGSTKIKGAGRS
jgi:hypothetical protein